MQVYARVRQGLAKEIAKKIFAKTINYYPKVYARVR